MKRLALALLVLAALLPGYVIAKPSPPARGGQAVAPLPRHEIGTRGEISPDGGLDSGEAGITNSTGLVARGGKAVAPARAVKFAHTVSAFPPRSSDHITHPHN